MIYGHSLMRHGGCERWRRSGGEGGWTWVTNMYINMSEAGIQCSQVFNLNVMCTVMVMVLEIIVHPPISLCLTTVI